MMRNLDNTYAFFLLFINKKNKEYFINNDNRDDLPNEKIIKKTTKVSKNLFPLENNGENWHRNYGNSANNRFSSLKLINKKNLNNLGVAWQYDIPGEKRFDIQSNAIIAENKIFIPSFNNKIIALEAKTGKFLWEH